MTRSRLVAAGLVAALTSGVLATAPAEAKGCETCTNGAIKVDATPVGSPMSYGFDIKYPKWGERLGGNSAKGIEPHAALADQVFGSLDMSMLRIPILASGDMAPTPGKLRVHSNVKGNDYRHVFSSVKAAKARDAQVRVFASLRSQKQPFAGWMRDGAKVKPRKYGRFLFDYLRMMKGRGVQVDFVGVTNETAMHVLGTQAANRAMANLRARITKHNASGADALVMPTFVGRDSWGPHADQLAGLNVEIAGLHYYNKGRDAAGLRQLVQTAGNRPVWDNEFHWDLNKDPAKPGWWWSSVQAMTATFDKVRLGISRTTFWNFRPTSVFGSNSIAQMQTDLVATTTGAQPLPTTDEDGVQTNLSSLQTQGFRQGNDLVVWVVNNTDKDGPAKLIFLVGANLTGKRVDWSRWTRDGTLVTKRRTGTHVSDKLSAQFSTPKRSVMVVRVVDAFA